MKQVLHVVDAFTRTPFSGNPAAVCVMEGPAAEDWMQRVAREMNLSETAFLHPEPGGGHRLRWFTPTVEVKLCGHATLASAFVLWETGALDAESPAVFHTLSGRLACRRLGAQVEMDFPATPATACDLKPAGLDEALGAAPIWVGSNGTDLLVELADPAALRALKPDLARLAAYRVRGIIVTSPSDQPDADFLSRFFAPAAGVNEDPVTGSAHCTLGPYWGDRLGRDALRGWQASERGGAVEVSLRGERVLLRGHAVLVSRVELFH
jgi:PhzF family phenazine biosynthesis protein